MVVGKFMSFSRMMQKCAATRGVSGVVPGVWRAAGVSLAAAIALVLATPSAAEKATAGETVRWLIEGLHDGRPGERAAAAERLGRMGDGAASAVPDLIALLGDEESVVFGMPSGVYIAASEALAQIGQKAVGALLEGLRTSDAKVRARIGETLGRMRPPPAEALPALVALLRDPDSLVRARAAIAIGRFGKAGAAAAPTLCATMVSDTDPLVRQAAVRAVASARALENRAIPSLIRALKDQDANVRGEAADAVAEYGPGAAPAVTTLIEGLSDTACCGSGFEITARHGSVRYYMAAALGKIGPAAATALPRLRKMLTDDPNVVVRVGAACSVLRIAPRDKQALNAIIGMLTGVHGEDISEPLVALEALEKIGPPAVQALPAIEKLMRNKDHMLCWRAVGALGVVGGKDGAPLLIDSLKAANRGRLDVDWAKRRDATEMASHILSSLGHLGPDAAAAIPVLLRMALQRDDDLSSFAVVVIGKIGPAASECVPALCAIVDCGKNDKRFDVAIVALGQIGSAAKAAVPRLHKLLASEPVQSLREDLSTALRQIEGTSRGQGGTDKTK
jgi:HEAT repeat protein